MGGDDLGDYDDYWNQPVVASHNDSDSDSDSDDSSSTSEDRKANRQPLVDDGDEGNNTTSSGSNGRKRKPSRETPPNPKKQKKSPTTLLLQAGRDIEKQDSAQQAVFLTTSINHYALIVDKDAKKVTVLPHHMRTTATSTGLLVDCIRANVSTKKMKQWKIFQSPCVIIVCLSARRCVTVLKELRSLKVQAAKLFPKNGSVEQQREQLSTSKFGLAVGTPHRLRQVGLSLEHTQLVILDCQLNHKQYTVATLPDTAPETMAFLRGLVLPQLKERKSLHLAFV